MKFNLLKIGGQLPDMTNRIQSNLMKNTEHSNMAEDTKRSLVNQKN